MKAKNSLISILKVVLPLSLGVWLIWWNYNALSAEQREELFHAFEEADLIWLFFSIVLGWFSHLSRAVRWEYLLQPLGYTSGLWNRYHCTMIGYFMNMLIPRAGEASRAIFLQRTEGVPFEKGFGTIIAERAIDLIMLGIVALIGLGLQLDKLDIIQERFNAFQETLNIEDGGFPWFKVIVGILILVGGVGFLVSRSLRQKIMEVVKGVLAGVSTIWKTPRKGAFILHTFIIWILYVAMFAIGFQSVAETADVPIGGIMAGFLAGTIGIILVQGGVGIYPPLVAIMVTLYMRDVDANELMHPAALALGWLIWVAQTIMIIGLGGLSLILVPRKKQADGTIGDNG